MLAGIGCRSGGDCVEIVRHAEVDGRYSWIAEECLDQVGRLSTISRGEILARSWRTS
jgi:hypothetical protein